MQNVGVQISRAQVSPFAALGRLLAASEGADEDGAEGRLFDSGVRVVTARAMLVRRALGAVEAEDVLARNEATVDENRQVALLARVDRRIRHFLRRQIHLKSPIESLASMHGFLLVQNRSGWGENVEGRHSSSIAPVRW